MRAEIYALVSALTFVAVAQRHARLWIDNHRALAGLQSLLYQGTGCRSTEKWRPLVGGGRRLDPALLCPPPGIA